MKKQTNQDALVEVEFYEAQLPAGREADIDKFVEDGLLVWVQTSKGRALFVPYAEGRVVPASFEYWGTGPLDWIMVVQVTVGEPARCVRLILDAPMGGQISAGTLRNEIPLPAMIEEAVLMAAYEVDASGRLVEPAIGDRAKTPAEARKLHKQIERAHRGPRRRHGRVNDELLDDVARIYNAEGNRRRPTDAVAEKLGIPRSTAGRWVGMARDAGKIEPFQRREK